MLNNRVTNYRRGLTLRLSTVVSVLACVALLGTASLLWAQPTSSPAAVAFGTTAGTQTLNITIPSGSLSSVSVVTQGAASLDFTSAGGTCASGSTSCTVIAKFAPTANGLRYGAVVLKDSHGNITAVPLSGVGTGPAAIFPPGTITTIAGVQYVVPTGGTGIESGDGGAATAAHFWGPNSLAFDGAGNLYIADWLNAVVRKINAQGVISVFAGIPSGSSASVCSSATDTYGDNCVPTEATLSYPEAVLVDGAGNVYITDSGDNLVRVVNAATGKISIFAGTVSATPAACQPTPPAAPTVPYLSSYNGGPATSAAMCYPNALAEDANGNIYISDYFNDMIHMVNLAGTITTVAGAGVPGAVTVCSTGDVYGNGCPATTGAYLYEPQDIALDGAGNLYIADCGNNLVREVSAATGKITALAGPTSGHSGDGHAASAAEIDNPFGIRLDGAGNIYFTEYFGNTIREISTSGIITTVAGNFTKGAGYSGNNGPATSAQINTPTRIAVDGAGNILIADYINNVVRKVNVSGGPTVPAFAATVVTQASTAQDVTLMNNGTSSLAVSSVSVPTNFNLNGTGNTCSGSGFSLTAASTCIFAIEFEPTVGGSIAGTLALTDNSVTGATQNIALSGTGTPDSQTITFTNPGTQAYGTPLTLSATASSGLAVSYSITSGGSIATLSSNVLTFTGIGSVTVQATQAGNASYNAAPSVSQTFSVGTETQTITFANPGTQTYGGGAITLKATASSGLPITYTVTAGSSIASVSGSALTLTGAGSVTIQAAQPGNTDVAAATPISQTFNVVQAAYTLPAQGSVAGMSISAGSSGTTTFTVTSQNYAGTVSFATSVSTTNGTAADVTATATPVTLTSGGTGTSTLTVTTTSGAANHAPKLPWKGAGALMACAVLLGTPFSLRRKRAAAVVLTGLAISLAGFLMACSGGGSSPTPTKSARTYTVTVTPTGTGAVANPAALTVTVTVQ